MSLLCVQPSHLLHHTHIPLTPYHFTCLTYVTAVCSTPFSHTLHHCYKLKHHILFQDTPRTHGPPSPKPPTIFIHMNYITAMCSTITFWSTMRTTFAIRCIFLLTSSNSFVLHRETPQKTPMLICCRRGRLGAQFTTMRSATATPRSSVFQVPLRAEQIT